MSATFGRPVTWGQMPQKAIKVDMDWKLSEETKEEIRKIEENIRLSAMRAPFIWVD